MSTTAVRITIDEATILDRWRWYWWPEQPNPAYTMHLKGCRYTTPEWWARDHDAPQRAVQRPEGWSLCLTCVRSIGRDVA